jgi:hypothetical protein
MRNTDGLYFSLRVLTLTKDLTLACIYHRENDDQATKFKNMTDREDSTEQEALSQDLVFELLSSPRRRFVLYYLRTESNPVKLTDLADEVAAWEYETPIEELTEQERKRAYVSLYQTHVPKLATAGLIDHDTDNGMLQLTDRISDVDTYLPSDDDLDIRWDIVYLSVSIVGAVIFSVGVSESGVFSVISGDAAGAIILLSFAITAIVHFTVARRQERQSPIELADDTDQ